MGRMMSCTYQTSVDGLRVQYTVEKLEDRTERSEQEKFEERLNEIYTEIEGLTCHADGYDYALAVSSGLISGLIDALFVREWDFARGKAKKPKPTSR